jgi:hypothetical protein
MKTTILFVLVALFLILHPTLASQWAAQQPAARESAIHLNKKIIEKYVPAGIGSAAPRLELVSLSLDKATSEDACDPEAAQFAIGQLLTPDLIETIKRKSKAQFVRVLPEGAGATRDYLNARINIHLDKAGRITAIRCG